MVPVAKTAPIPSYVLPLSKARSAFTCSLSTTVVLGQDTVMKKIEIQWPSGQKDVLENVSADAIYTLMEGKGIVRSVPFSKFE
jgi:hypothetical protein